jgi:uncharacterized protein (TIGR00251 family)
VLKCSEQDGSIHFTVQVVPRASRSAIVGEHDGALRVRVAAPPVEGAANEELIRTLSRALNVPRHAVEIMGGHTSKLKRVRVSGSSLNHLESLLGKSEES